MPLQQIYFGNGSTFLNANCLYTDSSLTTCAPDGWYSDGTVVRQQVGCVLLPYENCNCGLQCAPYSLTTPDNPSAEYNFNLSSLDIGAIVIEIFPTTGGTAFSFLGEYNGNYYNTASGDSNGIIHGSPNNQPTFVGSNISLSNCSLLNPGQAYTITPYQWNGSSFDPSTPHNIYTNPSQCVAAVNSKIVLVIPKPTSSPNTFSFKIQNICGAKQNIEIHCPAPLPSFRSSNVFTTPTGHCSNYRPNTFYYASVGGIFGNLDINDLVFQDPNGQYPLNDGFYRTTLLTSPNDFIQVINGVIVDVFKEPSC